VSPFRARALAVAALVALSGRAASAQDPDPVRLTIDLGFVSTSGNTEVTTFNMGEKLTYTTGKWLFGQAAAAIYGETDGSSTAEQYDAALRAEYSLGPHFLAFAGATWYRNTFAGITSRFVEGVGLGWRTVQAPRDTLRLDAAITSNQETNLALVQSTFAASRASLAYKHVFGASEHDLQAGREGAHRADLEADRAQGHVRDPVRQSAGTRLQGHGPRLHDRPADRVLTRGVHGAFIRASPGGVVRRLWAVVG
jgi:hypothetical protein